MREPDGREDVHRPMRRLNPTVLALIAGLVILVLLIAYYASSRNPDQDKLKDTQLSSTQAASSPEKRCASKATYDLIKRELFRRAAQVRGSDAAAYDNLSHYAVIRMENPVMESQDSATGAVNCSGSLSLDLPPGVAVVGGRRSLMADLDYTVESAADGTGDVVVLRNADAIVTPLATLARVGEPAQPTENSAEGNVIAPEQPQTTVPAPQVQPPAAPTPLPPPQPASTRPSFDCAKARTKGEVAVCSNAGLAALDRNMAAQYGRAIAAASPDQQALLRRTRDRFLAYRDRCTDNRCVGDAYVGRMREIRDIMEGRWQPPR
jgi:uncharacterized protein YecT (DUF1311 family)